MVVFKRPSCANGFAQGDADGELFESPSKEGAFKETAGKMFVARGRQKEEKIKAAKGHTSSSSLFFLFPWHTFETIPPPYAGRALTCLSR